MGVQASNDPSCHSFARVAGACIGPITMTSSSYQKRNDFTKIFKLAASYQVYMWHVVAPLGTEAADERDRGSQCLATGVASLFFLRSDIGRSIAASSD